MLAADKLQLQSLMKQQAVTLKEKEFNLHHSNCMTIGTQAAVLAGLDITMFIEFTPLSLHDYIYGSGSSSIVDTIVTHSHHAATVASNVMSHPHVRSLSTAFVATAANVVSRTMMQDTDSSDSADASTTSIPIDSTSLSSSTSADHHSQAYQYYIMYYTILYHIIHFLYYSLICTAFCCNVIVVAQTTILSVLGAGLALRGPDGSMMTATNILYQERSHIFQIFGYGLTFTILSVFIGVWLMFQHWTTALSCWCIATYTCYFIYTNYIRVSKLLYFPDNEGIDLHDLLSITSTNHINNNSKNNNYSIKSKQQQHQSTMNTGNADTDYYDEDNSHNHYDDDDTLYSSENPETESFIRSRNNHQHNKNNNMNHSRQRRRPKYQNHNNSRPPTRNYSNRNHTDDDMVVSSIQMV